MVAAAAVVIVVFLGVSQVMILMSGMVFLSKGFATGSSSYNALTGLVSIIVIVSMAMFISFVVFEVYRSIKYAKVHEKARAAEADRIEKELLMATRKKRMIALARLKRLQSVFGGDGRDAGATGDSDVADGDEAAAVGK